MSTRPDSLTARTKTMEARTLTASGRPLVRSGPTLAEHVQAKFEKQANRARLRYERGRL